MQDNYSDIAGRTLQDEPVGASLLIDASTLAGLLSVSLGTIHAMRRAGKLPLRVLERV